MKNIKIERGKDIQKWTLTCPFCGEEFDYEFNKKKGMILKPNALIVVPV